MVKNQRFGLAASSVAGQTMHLVGSEAADTAFMRFYDEENTSEILSAFDAVCEGLDLHPGRLPDFFPNLQSRLSDKLRYKELWKVLEKRIKKNCYGGNKSCKELKVLVVGAGVCGLRTAIECQLLGARVVVVESKDEFQDNNVLPLWKFVVEDLKQLGVQRLYSRLEPEDHEARHFSFDVLVGATGSSFNLQGFNRSKTEDFENLLITASLRNEASPEEALITEMPGLSREMHSAFFKAIETELKLKLEKLTYYRDDTHFFQFEVTPQSLVSNKILKDNFESRDRLLSKTNVNFELLKREIIEVCRFSTRYFSRQIPHPTYALNSDREEDISIHDFSTKHFSKEAGKVTVRKGFPLLTCLVGDTLCQFPWQEGTGTARGFLSCLDAAWMIRAWNLQANPLQVLEERRSLYNILCKVNVEDLCSALEKYDLDPKTRYKNWKSTVQDTSEYDEKENILELYDTDNKEEYRYLKEKFTSRSYFDKLSYANVVYRYQSNEEETGETKKNKSIKRLRSNLRKKSTRLRENIMIKLGRTKVTKDEELNNMTSQFRGQLSEVRRLNEVVENYLAALDEVNKAESELFKAWAVNIQNVEALKTQVLVPLDTYSHQFQEVKRKIDKGEQLRIEADILKYRNNQLKADPNANSGIVAAHTKRTNDAQDVYSTTADDLKNILPSLYSVRREFFAQSLYGLFLQQNNFHNELSYIYRNIMNILKIL